LKNIFPILIVISIIVLSLFYFSFTKDIKKENRTNTTKHTENSIKTKNALPLKEINTKKNSRLAEAIQDEKKVSVAKEKKTSFKAYKDYSDNKLEKNILQNHHKRMLSSQFKSYPQDRE
jgi:preprotein translocase subunit SecF